MDNLFKIELLNIDVIIFATLNIMDIMSNFKHIQE